MKATLRITSEEDYSRYVAFLLVSNFAIAFMGWPAYSVLRLGTEEWQSKKKLARTFLLHALLVLGSFVLLAGPAHQAQDEIERYISVPGAAVLVLAYASVAALGSVISALLKPAGRVFQFAFVPLLTRTTQVATLAALLYLGRHLSALEVMEVCAATALPQLVVGLILVVRAVLPPRLPSLADAERAVSFGLPVLVRQLGLVAFASVNFATIKHYLGFVDAGRFYVSGTIAEQTALLGVALEDLMGPILARAATKGDTKVLATYYGTIAPQVVFLWSTACGVAIMLAHPVLGALSAKAVAASAGPFQVLFLATALRMITTLEAPVFDSHLISKPPLAFFALGFAVNLGLDLALVPPFGIEGAAWATVGGWLVNALARSVYSSVRFQVRSLALYFWLLPVAVAFGYARFFGGASALADVGVAAMFVVVSLAAGRLSGVFSPETLAALEGVRMPAFLRGALARLYGARP